MHSRLSRREFVALAVIWPFSLFRRKANIGGTSFREIRRETDRRHYIWIHGNEPTARDVLEQHMKAVSGRAFLIENNDRYVPFEGGRLDPNRMFSREGAGKSLRALNPEWPADKLEKALKRLDREREGFLRRILPRPGAMLVALHNNGPNYSIKDEVSISDAVAMQNADAPDEFMLCTNISDYEVLAGGPYNVLLQNKTPSDDDGSLSRLCAARGIRYVNIEAAHGNKDGQTKMLNWLDAVII